MASWTYLPVTVALVLLGWWLTKRRPPVPARPPAQQKPQSSLLTQLAKAETRHTAARYSTVVQHYESLLRLQASAPRFRLLIKSHYDALAYHAALAASQRFERTLAAEFGVADLVLHAHLYTSIGEPQRAVAIYTRMLEQSIALASVYNNRGYAYNMLAEYLLAIQDFNQAIALKPNMAYAYNNRGLAYLRLGLAAEGRTDIEHSLQLDPRNAYAHRNLGIYYFDQRNYAAALPHFEQAQRLGQAPPQLADYLRQTRQHLSLPPDADEPPLTYFSDN